MDHLDRLEEIAKFCKHMVSIISHDLRSPLTSIVMSIRRLQIDGVNIRSEDAKNTLGQIERSVNGMLEMIDYILDIEKLSTGSIELYREQFNLNVLTEEVIAKIAEVGRLKGILLHNTVPAATYIFGDRVLLSRVLHNLLSNALKFCTQGDIVTVSIDCDGGVVVSDTGPGIDKELQSKLFQGHPSVRRGTSGECGFGLGLPSAYKIVEAHGGSLSVSSAPEQGAKFNIKLPPFVPHVVIVSSNPEFESHISGTMKTVHSEKLQLSTYKSIADCSLALDQLHKIPPDILVVDATGSENEGIALCHKIRSLFLGGDATIILCLTKTNPDDNIAWLHKEAITAGADGFFTKIPEVDQLAKFFHFIRNDFAKITGEIRPG
ncbi:ATP-binding protein [Dechloromonas sp. ARDL1]|uniref:ATP-binding response regulator n=1 Tax=Dechloromonas sp. ARDL1 TaxID=3322121 RepID=UPI003DA6D6E4